MAAQPPLQPGSEPPKITSRKVECILTTPIAELPDTLTAWSDAYQQLVLHGVRSLAVERKIILHLQRFRGFLAERYGHEQLSSCVRRDVQAWLLSLADDQHLAASTINNHLASLSGFTSWVHAQAPRLFALGNPAKGIGELPLPPLEPRALSDDQVRALKSVCDRLPRLYQVRGRVWADASMVPQHAARRPLRDRAIIFVLLSTGLRREELTRLTLAQVEPNTPEALRSARRARIMRVRGKGKSERVVFLSADARAALADYLEHERPDDASPESDALFLSAQSLPARAPDGHLTPRAINRIVVQIGRYHDSEIRDPARHLGTLTPHMLRHTFAFRLAQETGADPYELERRLGHRSQRYIQRYTNPPESVAAAYIEAF